MSDNPLLKKIQLPGKRFRLPSRGLFYTNGELDASVQDGEVEVFSMTTIDEITLRSPEFLYTGEAIERVFAKCIPDVKEPLKLLAKDIDFLLACLRIVSYGGTYTITTRCPACEETQENLNALKLNEFLKEVEEKAAEQEVPIDLAMVDEKVQARIKTIKAKRSDEQTYAIDLNGIILNKTTEIDDTEIQKYVITLSNGQVVHMTPMTMESNVAANQFQNEKNDRNLEEVEEFMALIISCTVKEVDGITDEQMIREWAKDLPVVYKEEIRKATRELATWGTEFDYTVTCEEESCGHQRNIKTLLNPITFFMTPSESEEPVS